MKQKWVKRIARVMLPCFLFFVFSFSFSPKVYAAESNLSTTYYLGFRNLQTGAFLKPLWKDGTTPIANTQLKQSLSFPAGVDSIGPYIVTSGTVWHTGIAKMYVSYYISSSNSAVYEATDMASKDAYYMTYDNSNGTRVTENFIQNVSSFQTSSAVNGFGYQLEASWIGSEGLPITRLSLGNRNEYGFSSPANSGATVTMVFPSIRVISSASSAELEILDSVASEIAAQSDILQAMKGDLVAILQDIYAMTGDIYIAQNLLNTYVSQMLPLLENIDQTTTDIFSLLSTQLLLLETAIENAADSVEAAISAQTAAMIAYLDSVLNTGNEVPDDTYQQQQDASNILDQMESLEKPNVDTIVPEIGDYSDSGVSGVLSAIFSSNLIVTMMTLSASFAFGAYVLFGKRE